MEKVAAARRGPDRSSERGTALVEFDLILPVFMTLVLGLITTGRWARSTAEAVAADLDADRATVSA